MKYNVKVVLVPDFFQFQVLIDTMAAHSELCNFVSKIVHERNDRKPRDLHYWVVGNENFYDVVRGKFPHVNTNAIPLAFSKIANLYNKKWPCEPYIFNNILDCSNYTITIESVLQTPNNVGTLSISTLAGRQLMHFIFDEIQRKELNIAFNINKFHEYQLVYKDDQFILITDVYSRKRNIIYDDHIFINDSISKIMDQLDTNDTAIRYNNEIKPTF